MDQRSFDRLARLLGEARDRRTGLKALVGGILGAGGLAALDADAEAGRKPKGTGHAGPGAERRKKKKVCNPACTAGFACVKGQCTCGGVTCARVCCADGEVCRDGACVAPRPACLPFGEACKQTGRRCCDGLTCASGQGGSFPVTCLRAKGAACASSDECPFGTSCTRGTCLGNGGQVPTGASCGGGEACAQPGATCTAYTTPSAPSGDHCTLPLRKVCTGNPECTCYNCWYVNDGATIGGRAGRDAAPVKACVEPKGGGCATDLDCARGLTCDQGTWTCVGDEQCAPGGAPCSGSTACCDGPCAAGVCPGGGGSSCTVNRSDYASDALAGAALKTAVESAADGAVITVGSGTYKPVPTGTQKAGLVITRNITIQACDPTNKPVLDGGASVTKTVGGGAPGATDNAFDLTWAGGNRIISIEGDKTVTIDGVHLTKGTSEGSDDDFGGALLARDDVTLTVRNLDISLSYSVESGGGLSVIAGTSTTTQRKLTVQNVNVTQCSTASGYGGGISAYYIPTEITGTAALKSKVAYSYGNTGAGGIHVYGNFTNGQLAVFGNTTLTLQYVEISNNYSDGYGGGMYVDEYGGKASASLSYLDVTNNEAYYEAGGMYLNVGSVSVTAKAALTNVVVQNNSVMHTNNSSYGSSGGIWNAGRMDLGAGVVVSGNKARFGSGVKNIQPTSYVTCTGTPVSGNTNDNSPTFTPAANGQTYADCFGGTEINTPTPANNMPAGCCATNA